jgi:GNAT superfamily N-acetyltransferase
VAVVWDLRVRPEARRRGIATELFMRGADWARENGYRRLKLEVTSANLPMCLFCIEVRCELAAVHRYGYETLPEASDEAMLIWFYEL